jgi:hypothetical protein
MKWRITHEQVHTAGFLFMKVCEFAGVLLSESYASDKNLIY